MRREEEESGERVHPIVNIDVHFRKVCQRHQYHVSLSQRYTDVTTTNL